MDNIEFKIEKIKNEDSEYDSARISINGKDIIKLLKEFETPFANKEGSESLAGAYAGITAIELYNSLTESKPEKVTILECECGSFGCWPFRARVEPTADKIIWTDFEQPHRSKKSERYWDYTSFGPFIFNKDSYIQQRRNLNKK